MNKTELHGKYVEFSENVFNLRKLAKNADLCERELNSIFDKCFKSFEVKPTKSVFRALRQLTIVFLKLFIILVSLYLCSTLLFNYHNTTSRLILRNVQNFIYPSLKIVRILAVPVLNIFPLLTEFYDETCLVENPYFQVADMECWPCESVFSVLNLTGHTSHSIYQTGTPYVVRTSQRTVRISDLQQLYRKFPSEFNRDASKLQSNYLQYRTIDKILKYQTSTNGDAHITWRINRLLPARLVRSLFPRPSFLSDRIGQSTERFIFIEEPNAKPFLLPSPECSYVFLIQGSGSRTLILKPAKECVNFCKTVSVVLQQGDVLWYNWWYWKPISLPSENASDLSISYMNSYC